MIYPLFAVAVAVAVVAAVWLVRRARARTQRLDVLDRKAAILGLSLAPGESVAAFRARLVGATTLRPARGTVAHARPLIEALDAHEITEDEVLAELPVGVTLDMVRAELRLPGSRR